MAPCSIEGPPHTLDGLQQRLKGVTAGRLLNALFIYAFDEEQALPALV